MLTAALENVLNRNLPRSPRARELAAELAGRRLLIEVHGAQRGLVLESLGPLLQLRQAPSGASSDPAADARVSGSPLALLALAGKDPEAVIGGGTVSISGDAEIAARFRELVRLLRPDLEEELARLIGDVPAHQGMRLAAGALRFGRRAVETGFRNLAEFLGHETGDLVSRAEAEGVFRDIERLRADLDRIEARIALLGNRRGRSGERA